MLSPMDLKAKKVEPKKRRYYDKEEMDEYLEFVYDNYKELYTENHEIKKNVEELNKSVQYYRSIETTMQKALVLAEKTAKETKDAAQLKAEAIEKDANKKAEKIMNDAEREYEKLKDKCAYLIKQFNQYKLQLKQVASAQLELVTSDSFDVYSPELESIQGEKTALPNKPLSVSETETAVETVESETASAADDPVQEIPIRKPQIREGEVTVETLAEEETDSDSANLDKTMVIPDVKKELSSRKDNMASVEENPDILTADTIDLSSSIEEIKKQENIIQKPIDAQAKEVQDALVLEPVDAVVTEPLNLQSVKSQDHDNEVLELEPESDTKETPTLDSLLQSINIGKKNKKKKGQDDDPFEFLGSVDDF